MKSFVFISVCPVEQFLKTWAEQGNFFLINGIVELIEIFSADMDSILFSQMYYSKQVVDAHM